MEVWGVREEGWQRAGGIGEEEWWGLDGRRQEGSGQGLHKQL